MMMNPQSMTKTLIVVNGVSSGIGRATAILPSELETQGVVNKCIR